MRRKRSGSQRSTVGSVCSLFQLAGFSTQADAAGAGYSLDPVYAGKYAIYGDALTPVGEGKVQWYPSDILYPHSGIYDMRFRSEKYPAKHKEEVLRRYYNYEKETLRDN